MNEYRYEEISVGLREEFSFHMTEEKMIKENLKEDYTYALISILEKFIIDFILSSY